MFNQLKTDYISWMFMIGFVLLFAEIVFFSGGLIYSLALAAGCMYTGRKLRPRKIGKILFWIGLISACMTVLNMMIFKFFLFAILAYLLLVFYQSKQNPEWIKPYLVEPESTKEGLEKETLIKKEHLFHNQLFGRQQTPNYVYEWNNINIQRGVGDTVIDLSYTILPKGENIISIRSFVGNLQVLVPYDVEVQIHHTVLAGRANIFQNQEQRVYNQIFSYQTEGFVKAETKVHLVTSVLIGDLEVKRI
jgi:lia operon protein LiaF